MQPRGTCEADSVMSAATPFTMPPLRLVYSLMAFSLDSAGTQQTSSQCSRVQGSHSSL